MRCSGNEQIAEVIRQAKSEGRYQEGIVDVAGDNFKTTAESVLWKNKITEAEIRLVSIEGDRGVTWDDALKKLETLKSEMPDDVHSGFYVGKSKQVQLWLSKKGQKMQPRSPLRVLIPISPESGFGKEATRKEIGFPSSSSHSRKKHLGMRKIEKLDDAEKMWRKNYDNSAKMCGHDSNDSKCEGVDCTFKKRVTTCHVLVGSLMDCWDKLKEVLVDGKGRDKGGKALKVRSTESCLTSPVLSLFVVAPSCKETVVFTSLYSSFSCPRPAVASPVPPSRCVRSLT